MNKSGVGTRVLNFLADTLIISLLSYGLYKWYMFYVVYYSYQPYQYYVFFYATLFVYYFLFEALLSRTPGKFLTMTRVRNTSGKRPGIYFVFFRTLLRLTLIDPFFIPVFGRPLHDHLSKTRVTET